MTNSGRHSIHSSGSPTGSSPQVNTLLYCLSSFLVSLSSLFHTCLVRLIHPKNIWNKILLSRSTLGGIQVKFVILDISYSDYLLSSHQFEPHLQLCLLNISQIQPCLTTSTVSLINIISLFFMVELHGLHSLECIFNLLIITSLSLFIP